MGTNPSIVRVLPKEAGAHVQRDTVTWGGGKETTSQKYACMKNARSRKEEL